MIYIEKMKKQEFADADLLFLLVASPVIKIVAWVYEYFSASNRGHDLQLGNHWVLAYYTQLSN